MKGNSVITAKQAKQITGGRTPLVPVQYEQAVKALAECISLDDAKVWSDKADALAAWGKIYRNDEALNAAKRLKVRARARIGELLLEITPRKGGLPGRSQGTTTAKDPFSRTGMGRSIGMSESEVSHSVAIARVPRETRDRLIEATPPARMRDLIGMGKSMQDNRGRLSFSAAYHEATGSHIGGNAGLSGTLRWMKAHRAIDLAERMTEAEGESLRKSYLGPISDWLDEFEQHLPKGPK